MFADATCAVIPVNPVIEVRSTHKKNLCRLTDLEAQVGSTSERLNERSGFRVFISLLRLLSV
jgi:hypothetical protein